jgi:glycerol kinase
VFDRSGRVVSLAQQEFNPILPAPGVVEHDADEIWTSQLQVAKDALAKVSLQPSQIAAIGITNQRETTVLWERDTGKPVANAIVWQSRITSPICEDLKARGLEQTVRDKTGLVIDAYFSGTKIKHLLDSQPGLRERAARGEILFGTIDTFLIWRLTGGRQHVTDYSNASRTLIYNIHKLEWDDELLKILDIPRAMLPEVRPSSEVYGHTTPELFGGSIPVAGCAGDQQAATFGQACFDVGSAKNTYGTGCFLLMNTGSQAVQSNHGLVTTIGWGLRRDNATELTYCLEGSVFVAGAAVQWLRDGLGIIKTSAEIQTLAGSVQDSDGVYFVPAFVGLGAPYWDPYARGAIFGITRGTKAAHIARAAVEAMAFQTRDVIEAMQKDSGIELKELRVDGGASVDDLLLHFQANLLGVPVVRPAVTETTALGAAYLAGLAVGVWNGLEDVRTNWQLDAKISPDPQFNERDAIYRRWQDAVSRTMGKGVPVSSGKAK